MTPNEYAHRAIAAMTGREPNPLEVEHIAATIAEAVAEERESCALVIDQIREQYRSPSYRTVLHIVSEKIRIRAGAAIAARRAS